MSENPTATIETTPKRGTVGFERKVTLPKINADDFGTDHVVAFVFVQIDADTLDLLTQLNHEDEDKARGLHHVDRLVLRRRGGDGGHGDHAGAGDGLARAACRCSTADDLEALIGG